MLKQWRQLSMALFVCGLVCSYFNLTCCQPAQADRGSVSTVIALIVPAHASISENFPPVPTVHNENQANFQPNVSTAKPTSDSFVAVSLYEADQGASQHYWVRSQL